MIIIYHLLVITYQLSFIIYHLSSWCLAIIWHCYQTLKWWTLVRMEKDEVMLLKCWDSRGRGKAVENSCASLGLLGVLMPRVWALRFSPCQDPSAKPAGADFLQYSEADGPKEPAVPATFSLHGSFEDLAGAAQFETWGMDQWVTNGSHVNIRISGITPTCLKVGLLWNQDLDHSVLFWMVLTHPQQDVCNHHVANSANPHQPYHSLFDMGSRHLLDECSCGMSSILKKTVHLRIWCCNTDPRIAKLDVKETFYIFLSKTSSFEWFFNLVSSVKRLSRAEGSPDDATDRESIEA